MKSCCFCVSFAHPQDAEDVIQIGQSIMWDNGAFKAYTKNKPIMDWNPYYRWLEPRLGHPHWAVIPDVIGGSVAQQRALLRQWPHGKLGVPVWHLDKPVKYLLELADRWPKICFGSAGKFWKIGSDPWRFRVSEAFDRLTLTFGKATYVHMMRGMDMRGQEFPFASADSANVAINYRRNYAPNPRGCAEIMAREIDSTQCPIEWRML